MASGFVRLAGLLACALVWWGGRPALAQSTAATFGEVTSLGGTPSDLVLDESRGRLYLVNSNANRVEVYSYLDNHLIASVQVGNLPVAAAMSMDNAFLYVTNNLGSSLSVIDLHSLASQQVVSLPARPEGVEVGNDGRVLITCEGTTVGTSILNTLLVYDKNQEFGQQLQQVPFPPPPPTPSPLPPTFIGRPTTVFRGKLIRTPDGQFIVGLSTINNNAQTILFVYETASATLLRSRTVTGQSTVLSMSPDGSRFMAGFTMYDTATLAVIGQQSTANAPFQMTGNFNTVQNVGGSAFSPDGETLYSAFNTAPFSLPAARPQSSTLLISSARNLGIRLGIRIPESIIAKMVITSDGAHAWGLSESGLTYLPLGMLYDYPILQPETTQVFLAVDACNKGLAKATIAVNNLGSGKLTFSVPNTGAALVSQVSSGVAPATITFIMEPGRAGTNRQPGTNLYTGGGSTNSGVGLNVNLASLEAINIPNTIRVFMNYRNPDQRGIIFPLPTVLTTSEGLQDLVLDETRGKLYVTNAGFNRIEVFDLRKQRFVGQIEVGQLPHQMAMGTDGVTLYMANQGGESISIVDLDLGREVGQVEFPPVPRAGNANPITPRALAAGLNGLQFVMSNGSQWELVGNQATVRPANAVTPALIGAPQAMLATPGFEYVLTLGTQGGRGVAYLYDALVDTYTTSRTLFNIPIQSYFGPLGAAPGGAFFLANGLVLNSSLTVIGGAERPGAIQFGRPAQPGQPPTQTIVSAGQRNVASVAAIDDHTFVRLTTPVRQNVNITATRDELRPTLELVDIRTGAESVAAVAAENPAFSVYGTQRINLSPRRMVVDSQGNAYLITISGLTVIPLATTGRPQLRGGARAIVNSADATPNFRPGSFITIVGDNLAAAAKADQIPPPTVLGGACVVFSDVAVPLLETSSGQISAQLPDTLRPGLHVVQVRSLATAQTSDPVVVTVQRPE